MIQAFRDKYRPGRYLIWCGLGWLMTLALLLPLWWIFHPQVWVLWVSAFAFALVTPTPKWVKRQPPP